MNSLFIGSESVEVQGQTLSNLKKKYEIFPWGFLGISDFGNEGVNQSYSNMVLRGMSIILSLAL